MNSAFATATAFVSHKTIASQLFTRCFNTNDLEKIPRIFFATFAVGSQLLINKLVPVLCDIMLIN